MLKMFFSLLPQPWYHGIWFPQHFSKTEVKFVPSLWSDVTFELISSVRWKGNWSKTHVSVDSSHAFHLLYSHGQSTFSSSNSSCLLLKLEQSLIEDQLSDSREWLFDTEGPSLADISVHFIFAWVKSLPAGRAIFNEKLYPNLLLVWISFFGCEEISLTMQQPVVARTFNASYQGQADSSRSNTQLVSIWRVGKDSLCNSWKLRSCRIWYRRSWTMETKARWHRPGGSWWYRSRLADNRKVGRTKSRRAHLRGQRFGRVFEGALSSNWFHSESRSSNQ